MFEFWRKQEKLIAILPKNYQSIVLYAISELENPEVFLDRKKIVDLSDCGLLTQASISKCRNFEIRNDKEGGLGFHDHPREMWVSENYVYIATYCEEQGWLKIESKTE